VIFDNRWYLASRWVELRGHGQLGEALEPAQQPRSALPEGISPTADGKPQICMFEDDNLITGLTIKTDRLLEPGASTGLAVLLIHVRTRPTLGT
jgi:hypothetical protein